MSALPHRRLVAVTALLGLGLLAVPASAEPDSRDPKESKPSQQAPSDNGNPGTIKVAAVGEDTHEDNNPKPGCALRVDFYGFNSGTYAVRITAQAPTGNGEQLAGGSVAITQPRKSADGHFQTSRTFDLSAALAAFAPAKQGYHVKVTVTDPSKPGNGGKHKVAWLDCVAGEKSTAQAAPRGTAARPAGAASVGARGTSSTATGTRTAGDAEVLGVKLTRTGSTTASAPTAVGSARDTLPFTGSPIGVLLWAATALLAWGALLTGVGRVHRSTVG